MSVEVFNGLGADDHHPHLTEVAPAGGLAGFPNLTQTGGLQLFGSTGHAKAKCSPP